jgi:hypothetical protein
VSPAALDHASEGPLTAPVANELPLNRPVWINYAAFVVALLFAVVIGLWITGGSAPRRSAPVASTPARPAEPKRAVVAPAAQPAQPVEAAQPAPEEAPVPVPPPRAATPAPIEKAAPFAPPPRARPSVAPQSTPVAPAAPRKSNSSKPSRETIF